MNEAEYERRKRALEEQFRAGIEILHLEIGEMVKRSWVYKRLRDFRTGIEGSISF